MSSEALAHKEDSTSAENSERRAARLDRRRVDKVPAVGCVSGELRTSGRKQRDEASYAMQTPLKVLKVLEALEGRAFEPATIERVVQRTGFTQSFCRAALITLKQSGYAKQTLDGYIVGPKLARFASRITAAHSEKAE